MVGQVAVATCHTVGAVAAEKSTDVVALLMALDTDAVHTVTEPRLDAPVPPFATGRIPSVCSFSLTFCAIFVG